MVYRTLGRTGLRVSLASLGTGGPSRVGQSTHGDESESRRVIHRALDLGINLFDSAAAYGNSEEVLGRALRGVPRERYFLATKFSPMRGDEIVPPEAAVQPGQVRDINSYSLSALVQQAGGIPRRYGIFPDR
ncbi:MAG: aldo/keto reductase, partial [Armatimonadota bacterium]|nr:aldo/keto reductase [Armatimonadota bacterium]